MVSVVFNGSVSGIKERRGACGLKAVVLEGEVTKQEAERQVMESADCDPKDNGEELNKPGSVIVSEIRKRQLIKIICS